MYRPCRLVCAIAADLALIRTEARLESKLVQVGTIGGALGLPNTIIILYPLTLLKGSIL